MSPEPEREDICIHCGRKIQLSQPLDYWYHPHNQMVMCEPVDYQRKATPSKG